ncbi:hypothetical protein GCM10027040_03060 [Halomonas shantousis]
MLTPWFVGCAATPGGFGPRPRADASRVELLYYADTLDTRDPAYPVVPATRLGPVQCLGQAPWATAASVTALTGPLDAATQALTDPHLATRQRFGGYAVLASCLTGLRESLGASNTLTLENGQCWNGSGMAHLTQGRAGVAGSHLLGAEARVSSDERIIWPQACDALYREFAAPVLGALSETQHSSGSVEPIAYFERGGARVAVVGITDPYAHDETRALDMWYAAAAEQVGQAREQADLVVVLADVGTGAGLWLAERLDGADVLLCARGQDFWPQLIPVMQADGRQLPVCLPGTRGVGVFQLSCTVRSGQWQIEARFHPALRETLSAPARQQAVQLQRQLDAARAPYADWLDRPLAVAPDWLWRRDVVGGSWDGLISAALRQGGPDQPSSAPNTSIPTLSPGLRYDVIVAPGEPITRNHLIALSGGHAAPVFALDTTSADIQALLERASDQSFGQPLLLDTAQDLPRLDGIAWRCRYSAETGQRISMAETGASRLMTWSIRPDATAGEPLWQRMERYLSGRDAHWTLPPRPEASLSFVDGHPGWHPEARLGS